MVNVAIVEDDTDIRDVIRRYLDTQQNLSCKIACDSVEALFTQLKQEPLPNVILMDIGLPGMSGISGIRLLKEKSTFTQAMLEKFLQQMEVC